MPYIYPEERDLLNQGAIPQGAGQLNYVLSKEVDTYLGHHGINYTRLNEVMGVLACMQAEVYRRMAAPYEDQKNEENGEVFESARR